MERDLWDCECGAPPCMVVMRHRPQHERKWEKWHHFILVAIEYFTKWVEAASYANVTREVVVRFIKKEIICRYGLPKKIITDNATNLNNKMMKEKTSRRSFRRWQCHTRIGTNCYPLHCMVIELLYALLLRQPRSLWCMGWKLCSLLRWRFLLWEF